MARPRFTREAEHFTVVTPFEYEGRDFREGEPFPWREFGDGGLTAWQRQILWVANKIAPCAAPAPAVRPDALGGFEVLARIGASIAPPPAAPAKPAKRTRAGA